MKSSQVLGIFCKLDVLGLGGGLDGAMRENR